MRNIIYCRISTAEQSSASLQTQEDTCRKQIGNTTDEIIVVRDVGSGKDTEQRPNFRLMMDNLQPGDRIYVYDQSRLSRDAMQSLFFFNEIQQRGAELYCDGKKYENSNPIDKMIFTVQSGYAEFQRALQNKKAIEGMEASKKSGDWAVRGDLFGFHSYRVRGKVKADIDPIAAKYIQYIFTQYSTGRSSRSIGKEMESIIVPGYEHYRFTPVNVTRMINQPLYMGYMMPKKDKILKYSRPQLEEMLIKSNVYEPIVSPDLWWKCFESHRTVHRSHTVQYEYRYSFYELSSIFKCPYCKATWNHHFNKMTTGVVYEKYRSLVHTCDKGEYRDFHKDSLEYLARTCLILTFLDHDEVECFFKTERDKVGMEKDELQKELDNLEELIDQNKRKMEKLTDLAMDDAIDREIFKDRMGKLKEESTKLVNSRNALSVQIQQKEALVDDYYEEATRDVLDEYSHLEGQLRRDVLKRYIKNAYVRPEGFEIEFLNGKRFTTDMWKKRIKKLTPLTMTVSFKGEEQYKAILSFPGFKMVDEDYGDSETNLFFYNRNREIERKVNDWLSKM